MKVKTLKALVSDYGRLNRGDVIDLPNYVASQLLAYGYVELDHDEPSAALPTEKREPRRRKAAK